MEKSVSLFNLLNLENILRRNLRTGMAKECIFRASGGTRFMLTCKFLFLILYLLFKNLFSTASTQLQEKDVQHFLLTNNF